MGMSHRQLIIICSVLAFLALSCIGLLAYQHLAVNARRSDQIYTNMRYKYRLEIPSGWRLATAVTLAVNDERPTEDADFVYFTRLSSDDEMLVAKTVPADNPLSAGPVIQKDIDLGDFYIVFANTVDAGLNFAYFANRIEFPNTTIAPVDNVSTELIGGITAVKYDLRRSAESEPLATIFISDASNPTNLFGQPVLGFTIQTGAAATDPSFPSFYRSFEYLP